MARDVKDVVFTQRLVGDAAIHDAHDVKGQIGASLVGVGAAQQGTGREGVFLKPAGHLYKVTHGTEVGPYTELAGTVYGTAHLGHLVNALKDGVHIYAVAILKHK